MLLPEGKPLPGAAVWFCPWVGITGGTLCVATESSSVVDAVNRIDPPLIDRAVSPGTRSTSRC